MRGGSDTTLLGGDRGLRSVERAGPCLIGQHFMCGMQPSLGMSDPAVELLLFAPTTTTTCSVNPHVSVVSFFNKKIESEVENFAETHICKLAWESSFTRSTGCMTS